MRFFIATIAVITGALTAAFPSDISNFGLSARDVQLEQSANAILANMSVGLDPGEFTVS
jgi:hypothetical protein